LEIPNFGDFLFLLTHGLNKRRKSREFDLLVKLRRHLHSYTDGRT